MAGEEGEGREGGREGRGEGRGGRGGGKGGEGGEGGREGRGEGRGGGGGGRVLGTQVPTKLGTRLISVSTISYLQVVCSHVVSCTSPPLSSAAYE